jgi:uncharacterized membrane protein
LLYSALANISITVFGEHPWSIRLPAAIFGIVSIPMLYLVGRAASNRFEAILATAILTVSYHHIWFSQNARGYAPMMFFVLLATYLVIQWLVERKKFHFLGYALVAALGSYTHLTMVFVVITHAVICAATLFYERRTTGEMRDWKPAATAFLLSGLFTLILYAPLLTDMVEFFTQSAGGRRTESPVWAMWAAIQGLRTGFGGLEVLAAGAIVFSIGAISYLKTRPSVFFLFLLPAPVVLALGIAMGRPIYPRFIFFVMGFGLLIVIRGAVVIGDWLQDRFQLQSRSLSFGTALALLFTLSGIVVSAKSLTYGYSLPKQDYAGAIKFIEDYKSDDDTVVVIPTSASEPIRNYYGKPWPEVRTAAQLQEMRSKTKGLIVVFSLGFYIESRKPELWSLINTQCREIETFRGTIGGGDIHVKRCHPLNIPAQM